MNDIIQRIKQKLAYLRDHEDFDETDADIRRQWQVLRSSRWEYQLKPPGTVEQLASFEAQYGIVLPDEYRRFLLEVGTGGAGPGNGLHSPFEDMLPWDEFVEQAAEALEDDDWATDVWEMPVLGKLHQPFLFTGTTTMKEFDRLTEPYESEKLDEVLHAGHLTLADGGGNCHELLIITGAARGQIWDQDGCFYSPLKISGGKRCQPPYYEGAVEPPDAEIANFTQWYNAWLDEEIAIAQNHWQKHGRTVPPFKFVQSN